MSEPLIDPKRGKELIERWSKILDSSKTPEDKLSTHVLYEAQETWVTPPGTKCMMIEPFTSEDAARIKLENSKIDS